MQLRFFASDPVISLVEIFDLIGLMKNHVHEMAYRLANIGIMPM